MLRINTYVWTWDQAGNFCATNGISLCLLSGLTFESLTIKAERMEDLCIDNSYNILNKKNKNVGQYCKWGGGGPVTNKASSWISQ